MRILFIVNQFPSKVDGVGDYTFCLASYLFQHGVHVSVLCNKNVHSENELVHEIRDLDQHFEIKESSINLFPIIGTWSFSWYKQLEKLSNIFNPDVISLQYVPYAYQKWGIPVVFFLLPEMIGKRKLTVTFHEIAVRYSFSANKKSYIIGSIQRLIAARLASKSICSFTSINHYLEYIYSRKKPLLLPIGNSLQLAPKFHLQQRTFSQKGLKLITFGFRDYENVLQALKIVSDKFPIEISFTIMGKFSEARRVSIMNLSKKHEVISMISLPGYLSGDQVLSHLFRSDVFLDLTYSDEKNRGGTNFKSTSFASAVSTGLPIIGFKGDMTDNLLKHGENIWFCEDASPMTIADAIVHLAQSPALRETLHQGAVLLHENYLSWNSIGNKYLSALKRCLVQ